MLISRVRRHPTSNSRAKYSVSISLPLLPTEFWWSWRKWRRLQRNNTVPGLPRTGRLRRAGHTRGPPLLRGTWVPQVLLQHLQAVENRDSNRYQLRTWSALLHAVRADKYYVNNILIWFTRLKRDSFRFYKKAFFYQFLWIHFVYISIGFSNGSKKPFYSQWLYSPHLNILVSKMQQIT